MNLGSKRNGSPLSNTLQDELVSQAHCEKAKSEAPTNRRVPRAMHEKMQTKRKYQINFQAASESLN
ncbi:hypothetical protein RB10763 [Rhodopirellula baltica SH 1]|uniref:Uncharacterized protein n=1 Tax=Rhodopirellula baltica (strain DSM 10527 / NCIMB 13988 / SH1) TaxID=243090 RepID=Q7UKA1_RHOBA|nr:hypothetical protein RB10763 [Rhodopirellula baltica SH 1]